MEKKYKSNFKNLAQIFFIYTIRYLILLVPPHTRSYIAEIIGYSARHGEKAQAIKHELQKLVGTEVTDNKLDRITLKALNNYRKDFFDTWCFPKLNQKNIKNFGYLDGKENLDQALKKGKGAIVAVSHFGLWKAILPVLGYANYPVTQIAKNPLDFMGKENSLAYNKIMEIEYQCEKSLPSKFIYLGQFLRPVYKSLADNEVVVISFDGIKGTKRILTKLLSREAYFSSSPVTLSLATGSPLLPAFVIREKDGRHRVKIEPELTTLEGDNRENILQNTVNAYAKMLAEYITEYPCHYAMFMYIAMVHSAKGDQKVFL